MELAGVKSMLNDPPPCKFESSSKVVGAAWAAPLLRSALEQHVESSNDFNIAAIEFVVNPVLRQKQKNDDVISGDIRQKKDTSELSLPLKNEEWVIVNEDSLFESAFAHICFVFASGSC